MDRGAVIVLVGTYLMLMVIIGGKYEIELEWNKSPWIKKLIENFWLKVLLGPILVCIGMTLSILLEPITNLVLIALGKKTPSP